MAAFADYWRDNWPALLPAIIFLVVNPWSIADFVRRANARAERANISREEVVDRVEATLISGVTLSRGMLFGVCDSIAARRDVKTLELHQPVWVLREVSRKLHRNPALDEARRTALIQAVDSLIREVKETEGVLFLDELAAVLPNAKKYPQRGQAIRLIKELKNWETFEDANMIENLKTFSDTFRLADSIQRACAQVAELRRAWSPVGPPEFLGQPRRQS